MSWVVRMLWVVVGAGVVAWLLAKQEKKNLEAVERGEEVALSRTTSPSSAFLVCCLFLITAPFVLGRSRGVRGVLEGIAILFGVFVCNVATSIALVLVHR